MVTITDAVGEIRVTAHDGDTELDGLVTFEHRLEADPASDGFRYRIVGLGGNGRVSIYVTPDLLRGIADSMDGAAERLR